MKFTINSRVLRSALELANKGINPKPTFPALANFLLEGNGTTIAITGSDMNTTIKETLDCEAEGKALLPTNLLELVRTLNEDDVTIETFDTNATISWKNGKSTIPVFNPGEYPEIADYDGGYLVIKGDSILSALAHTISHTANDDLRPVMNGVLFNAKDDGTMDFVASDFHTLGLYTIKSDHKEAFSFVCPASALKIIGNLAKSGDVEVASDKGNIYFCIDSTTIIVRNIVGKFPNYSSAIPKSFNSTLTAEKGVLLNSIKRVLVCANKASGHLKLTLGMFKTCIEAQDLSFGVSAKEELDNVEYEGEDLVIGFKGDLLIKCIAAIESDTIKINFTGANRAAIVTSDEDPSTMLIMPVKI